MKTFKKHTKFIIIFLLYNIILYYIQVGTFLKSTHVTKIPLIVYRYAVILFQKHLFLYVKCRAEYFQLDFGYFGFEIDVSDVAYSIF